MVPRTSWDELPDEIRHAVAERTGPIRLVQNALAGKNSAVALVADTVSGRVFVKGLRKDHPAVVTQAREAVVNPYIRDLGPTLLWHTEVDVWNLLGFAHLPGRHADFRPHSPDIGKVVTTMCRLSALSCPDLPGLKRAEQRWARYVDRRDDLALLAGEALLHTDYNPDNVLVDGDEARLIDWAWPTLGASFIDPACLVVRLVAAGHAPAEAEAQVRPHPGWNRDAQPGIDVFATALERMWAAIASTDPSSVWKAETAAAARAWAQYRRPPTD